MIPGATGEPEAGEPLQGASAEMVRYLGTRPRSLPSKYLYDARGTRLFEAITGVEDYYPGRTERSIIAAALGPLARSLGDTDIIELGSGDCSKVSLLLDMVPAGMRRSLRYFPVDISRTALAGSAAELGERFPKVRTRPVLADFMDGLPDIPEGRPRLFCFLGGTIGNLERSEASGFLGRVAGVMEPGDRFLLGLDMMKDVDDLLRAYDDSAGVTADFNLNILRVVDRALGTELSAGDFAHVARFSPEGGRIEMHLEALADLRADSPELEGPIMFERGETIHTESSHKYTPRGLERLVAEGGLRLRRVYQDRGGRFSLVESERR